MTMDTKTTNNWEEAQRMVQVAIELIEPYSDDAPIREALNRIYGMLELRKNGFTRT